MVQEAQYPVGQDAGTPAGVLCFSVSAMSKCHLCGTPDTATVLIKCQRFGRGTKWLCLECVRSTAARPAGQLSPARRGDMRAGGLDLPVRSCQKPQSERSPACTNAGMACMW